MKRRIQARMTDKQRAGLRRREELEMREDERIEERRTRRINAEIALKKVEIESLSEELVRMKKYKRERQKRRLRWSK